MKRILSFMLAMVCLFSVLTSCGTKSSSTTMKLASNTSVKSDSYDYASELMFQELIQKYSNGTITVEHYPASQMGSTAEMVEAVGVGTIQATAGICFDVFSNIEPMCLISCMPYLFRDYEHFKAYLETDNEVIKKVKDALAENADVLVVGYVYRPARILVTTGNGISKPEDLKDMVIRSTEASAVVNWLKTMGAFPVTITFSEVFTSLSQGAVAGAGSPITLFADSNFQNIVDYCSETNHIMDAALLTVNKTWFEALTLEQQNAILRAADEVTEYSWNEFQSAMERAWKKFEDAGVTCIRSSEIDFEAFQTRSAHIHTQFVEDGYFTEEDYQKILNINK